MQQGSDSARITVYMFASYTCHHCHEFLLVDLPRLQQRYIDSGQVKFVVKPINIAENRDMMSALQLAGCMNNDGNADAFISFFPQLLAGPIGRASKLIPQFEKKRIFFKRCFRNY